MLHRRHPIAGDLVREMEDRVSAEAGDDPQRPAIDAAEPVTRDRPDNVDDDRRGAKRLTHEQDDAQRKGQRRERRTRPRIRRLRATRLERPGNGTHRFVPEGDIERRRFVCVRPHERRKASRTRVALAPAPDRVRIGRRGQDFRQVVVERAVVGGRKQQAARDRGPGPDRSAPRDARSGSASSAENRFAAHRARWPGGP